VRGRAGKIKVWSLPARQPAPATEPAPAAEPGLGPAVAPA
jgi:hypothetical protein